MLKPLLTTSCVRAQLRAFTLNIRQARWPSNVQFRFQQKISWTQDWGDRRVTPVGVLPRATLQLVGELSVYTNQQWRFLSISMHFRQENNRKRMERCFNLQNFLEHRFPTKFIGNAMLGNIFFLYFYYQLLSKTQKLLNCCIL